MKDRRRHPRMPVRYLGTFSTMQRGAGEGIVLDLSPGGCRVESSRDVRLGTELALRISLPNQVNPLAVDRAIVRWGHGHQFGLCFTSLRPEEQTRLHGLVGSLRPGGTWPGG
jgi:PilZ domain-containing protein